jgi:hypothetical protein
MHEPPLTAAFGIDGLALSIEQASTMQPGFYDHVIASAAKHRYACHESSRWQSPPWHGKQVNRSKEDSFAAHASALSSE